MKLRNRVAQGKVELQMTSMIDIVFLLLIFFLVTFKISAQEGDFNIKMPKPGEGSAAPPDVTQLPLKLRLKADSEGTLEEIVLNESLSFGTNWESLRAHVAKLLGPSSGPTDDEGPEVEIDLDYNLRYEHVIAGITAVTGYRSGNDVVRLVQKIKFAPQRK
jgi:biopolymer transport protein ExbD